MKLDITVERIGTVHPSGRVSIKRYWYIINSSGVKLSPPYHSRQTALHTIGMINILFNL